MSKETPYTKAIESILKDNVNFFSTNRTIDLKTEAVKIQASNIESFNFSLTTDLFKNVTNPVKIKFERTNIPFNPVIVNVLTKLENEETENIYRFFPTTIDFIRIAKDLGKKALKKDSYTLINEACFQLADQLKINIFSSTVQESKQFLKETEQTVQERVDAIIQRELKKIENGETFKHQNSKLDRVKFISKIKDKYDYGTLILSYITKAKAKGYENSRVYLTDKAIEFVFSEDMTVLRGIAFKDPYGLGKTYKDLKVISIPMSLVLKAVENQAQGLSTLDNQTSKLAFNN